MECLLPKKVSEKNCKRFRFFENLTAISSIGCVSICGSGKTDRPNKGGTDAGNGLSKLELAKAMLRFIATPADPINEGLHYVGEAIDPEVLDETLQLIFKHMGQEGHYRMMMGLR